MCSPSAAEADTTAACRAPVAFGRVTVTLQRRNPARQVIFSSPPTPATVRDSATDLTVYLRQMDVRDESSAADTPLGRAVT